MATCNCVAGMFLPDAVGSRAIIGCRGGKSIEKVRTRLLGTSVACQTELYAMAFLLLDLLFRNSSHSSF